MKFFLSPPKLVTQKGKIYRKVIEWPYRQTIKLSIWKRQIILKNLNSQNKERASSNKRKNKADRPQKQGNQGGKKLVALSLGDRIFRQGGKLSLLEKNQENTDKNKPCGKKGWRTNKNFTRPILASLRKRLTTKRELIKIPKENRNSRNSVNWREGKYREEKTPNWILQKLL